MADLVTSLTEDATGYTKPAPKRRRQTIWTPHGELTPRQLARQARSLAERWYQALRAWDTRISSEVLSSNLAPPNGSGGNMRVVGVGNYGLAGATITYSHVHTPLGWISENALAATLRQHDGQLLDRIRAGQGLSTLLHASGRGWAGEQARNYARTALSVAASLGDPEALTCLQALTNAEES
ncbi:hypothetical protein E7T09_04160 [Deinococcus sp. KSM4-11]|uniref:hypothetical protein n=1 Tax=Deinococcus sp. KSM4-11 TaxID=2568654 RepID=UPI0010A574C9|nr:hypothetical protein [Deinococcus sp. KSM4-11]THF88408.1 hypothetical protein E7T09_04160 [Deinococcus sp. KSM4-11]